MGEGVDLYCMSEIVSQLLLEEFDYEEALERLLK
jgi:hypothetical protein